MTEIIEKERTLPVLDSCDVFVAGGGIAGVSAALAAARNGAKVILAEKQCIIGGLATAGLVTIYLPLCDGMGRQVSFGQAEELLKLSVRHGAEKKYPEAWLDGGTFEEKKKQRYEVQFNASLFAIEMERLLIDTGVKILYDTQICSTVVNDNKITAIITENKSGRCAYSVKSVVDASGDADICKFAGEATKKFAPGNVLAAWSYGLKNRELELKMLGYAEIPDEDKVGNEPKPLISRRFSGIDGEEISEMLQNAHNQILIDFISERKEDKNYVPVTIPTMPQLRMTRRIDGVYSIDTKDEHKEFSDSIGLVSNWKKCGPVYEIPFGTLHGNHIKNLICAGRCISATDSMWDVTRVIPVCAVTGQAAGTAAAISDDFCRIDISALQKRLCDSGVVLHENHLCSADVK